MAPPTPTISLPKSYTKLPFTQIKVSHVPAEAAETTPTVLVTLHRPNNHNAFTRTMESELIQIFKYIDLDPRIKCAVVTGSGDRTFCAGADLSAAAGPFKGGEEHPRDHRDGGGRVALAIHHCRKPIIAAIQGNAVGVGITMTLPMSIRIACEKAKIGFVFAKRGLVMEACSSYFLPRLIGMAKALHLTTTASVLPASHPLLDSLFSETLPTPEAVLPRALELAAEIVANTSPTSTYLMREMMYRDAGSAEGQHLLDSKIIYELFSSRDNKEGVAAFMEKRPVKFEGDVVGGLPAAWPWWDQVGIERRVMPEGYVFREKGKL